MLTEWHAARVSYIRDAQRHAQVPRLTHAQNEAMDLVEAIAKRHLLRLWLAAHDFASVEGMLRSGIPQRR